MKPWIFLILIFLILAACDNKVQHDYLPLGKVLTKEYTISQTFNDDVLSLKNIIHHGKSLQFEGNTLFPFFTAGGERYFLFQKDNSMFLGKTPGQDSTLLMPMNPRPGMQWQLSDDIKLLKRRHESFAGSESFISVETSVILNMNIESLVERVSIPTGRYENCLLIKGTSSIPVADRTRGIDTINIEQLDWYAKGIGLIKSQRREFTVPGKFSITQTQLLNNIY